MDGANRAAAILAVFSLSSWRADKSVLPDPSGSCAAQMPDVDLSDSITQDGAHHNRERTAMAPREIEFSDLPSLVGEEIGVSDWHHVTQNEVNTFAKATHDTQWIHVDVERAKKESPFGGPVAHGYYTLSLIPFLMDQIWIVRGTSAALNYGLNRLRFPAPVLVGSQVRLRAKLNGLKEVPGGVQVVMNLSVELKGIVKPACVAEGVFRYYA